ncbi:MAG TPA: sigma-70 family RNA polymerase sigma factor [Candidatus Scatomorpha pullicola]|nr:sigma-70 family RNA polymerase sigma factor [Candidatus Scatomorpha pullicola]
MDKEEFTRAVLEYESTLYRVAKSMLGSEADCADAAQNALLRAWEKQHTLRDTAYFKTWLTRILINECRAMLRQRARFVPLEEEAAEGEIAPERDSGLYEAVMGLDVKYRVPFVLYYIEGFRTREIASMLKLPEGTVKTRLRRAREILRTELEGACYA